MPVRPELLVSFVRELPHGIAAIGLEAGPLVPHDDWLTVIFCGDAETQKPAVAPFDRRIVHGEARKMIPGYPAMSGPRHADSAPL